MHKRWIWLVVALAVGCGGGGGGGGGGFAGGGVTGTGSAEGTISAFGSIFVNGIRWDTSSAEIFVNEQLASEADLRLGQRVRISGNADGANGTGVATRVEYDEELLGAVVSTNLNADGDRLTVSILNRDVILIRGQTTFDGTSFTTVSIGDILEVSGLERPDGSIFATRVEFEGTSAGGPFDVDLSGPISNFDAMNDSFEINGVAVLFDSTGAMTDLDLDGQTIANGLEVEVEGTSTGGVIFADEIELEDEFDDSDQDFASLEGFISNFTDFVTPFTVGGVTVNGAAAVYFGSANLFTNGARVRVEGQLSGGVLIASTVESRSSEVRIEAELAPTAIVDPANGLLTILGIPVVVDTTTRFEDDDSEIGLADLQPGDFLEIRGTFDTGSGQVFATRIEREDDGDEITLQGPVQSFTSTSVMILGVNVDFDLATEFEDENENDVPIASVLIPGRIIKITDEDDGDATAIDFADEIELEDLDD